MVCPKCGAARTEGAAECPQCGVIYARYRATQAAPPEPERPTRRGLVYCPTCRKQVSGNAEACPHCGEPIRDNPHLVPAGASMGFRLGMLVALCFAAWLAYWLWWGAFAAPSAQDERRERAEKTDIITIAAPTLGCRAIEDFRKLADMAARDQEAFSRSMIDHIAAGRCILLNTGASVHREEVSLGHGAVRVRLAGQTETWWINDK